jgi:hypothetical protein
MTHPPRPPQGPSRQNHYVPEWYQAGFGVAGADNWLLNISTPRLRPDGSPIPCVPRQRPPKSCFWEEDLYITRFGEQINDQIETVLFQGIDDFGANAVRAFIRGDMVEMHQHLAALFAYLGAQKLRTPKGLDWIRSRYPALSQLELMVELQHLRQMFGTLWAESVREIVCAEHAGVKFLVTDHPVTTFNAVLPDDAPQLAYPHDAPITWNGSQTLFPLDANHLLILTHVPYAKAPHAVEAASKRINARYFGNTLMRTDALIRSRQFDTDAVIAVNAWLKSRAHRYIAAGQREWLHPERYQPVDLSRLAQLLRPPEDGLWHFGGEIHIGYKDGTFGYRDEYGRTSREHEFVAKVAPATPPAAEASCPCGSGRAFGACCLPRAPWERPPWDVLSLRERNLGFIRAVTGVLGLDQGTPWTTVQRELTDEQVARLHRIAQGLWPEGTDLVSLLPRPGKVHTRAVYMGPSDPRTVAESVIALVPLFDQILVMDPFLSSRNIRPEYSPVTVPAQHKQQFLKNVLFWLTLAPMIEAGKVVVFPDPGDLSPEFEYAMRNMALERTAEWNMDPAEIDELRWLVRDDFERSLLQLPDEALLPMFSKSSPELSETQARDAIAYMRSKREGDPFALLQILGVGEQSAQYLVMRCVNLEVALFMAQSTGAVIVTDVRALWTHLHLHTRAAQVASEAVLPPSAPIRFRAPLNPFDALAVAETPSAVAARDALRDLQAAADTRVDSARTEHLEAIRSRMDGLVEAAQGLTNPELQVAVTLTPSIPPSGFESPTAQRLVVGFGRDDAPVFLGLAFFRQTEGNIDTRAPNPVE